MKKILWLIIVLAIIAGAVYFVAQKQVNAPVVVDTTGWKTYTNDQYGFEVKYPSQEAQTTEVQGMLCEPTDNPSAYVGIVIPDGLYYNGAILLTAPLKTTGEFSKVSCDDFSHDPGLVSSTRKFTIMGETYEVTGFVSKVDPKREYYEIPLNRLLTLHVVLNQEIGPNTLSDTQYGELKQTLDSILSTFRFTK